MGIPGGDGSYMPCVAYHLGEDGVLRIVCYGAVARQAVDTHAPLGGTMGGTAGGEGRRGDWRYEKRDDRYQAIVPCHVWWTRRGSNPRPSACKAAAPPIELLA